MLHLFSVSFLLQFRRIYLSTRFALATLFFSSLSPLISSFLMTSNDIFVPQFHTLLTQQSTSDHLLLYQFTLILKIFSILAKILTRPSITVVDLLTASHLIAFLQFISIIIFSRQCHWLLLIIIFHLNCFIHRY